MSERESEGESERERKSDRERERERERKREIEGPMPTCTITSVDHKGVTCYGLRGRGVESRSLMMSVETRDLSERLTDLERIATPKG